MPTSTSKMSLLTSDDSSLELGRDMTKQTLRRAEGFANRNLVMLQKCLSRKNAFRNKLALTLALSPQERELSLAALEKYTKQ